MEQMEQCLPFRLLSGLLPGNKFSDADTRCWGSRIYLSSNSPGMVIIKYMQQCRIYSSGILFLQSARVAIYRDARR